jgi:oligoribonuclease (3'-5' exoribonuclease)
MANKLIIHVHTSGIDYNSSNITENYQIISIAAIVLSPENKKLSAFEKYISFDEKNKWDNKAHDTHGISRKKLESIGEPWDSVHEDFILFLADNFDVFKDQIQCIGYSIDTFTLPFVKQLLTDVNIKFSYCNIDLKSLFCLEQNRSVNMKEFISFFKNTDSFSNPPSLEMCNIFYMAYRYYTDVMESCRG